MGRGGKKRRKIKHYLFKYIIILLIAYSIRKNVRILFGVIFRGVNTVPYRPVRLVYTVPASKLVWLTTLFRIRKNTGRTGQFRAISGVQANIEKSFYFYFYYYYYFLSFVIFEFLLGQNSNLFALTY